jgi:hypothetical protein
VKRICVIAVLAVAGLLPRAGHADVVQDRGDGAAASSDGLAHVGVVTAATVELAGGFYSGLEVDGLAYFRALPPRSIPPMTESPAGGPPRVSTPFALRFNLLLIGKRW